MGWAAEKRTFTRAVPDGCCGRNFFRNTRAALFTNVSGCARVALL